MSLYHITAEMQAVQDAFERCGGDGDSCDPEGAVAMREHIDALVGAFDAKAESYAALIRNAESRAEARKAEATRILALSAADSRLATRLRQALMEAMQATGRTTVQTALFALSVRQNGGKRPVVVEDEESIPEQFRIPTFGSKLDRDALRDALESGESVPGASLGERGVRLDLR